MKTLKYFKLILISFVIFLSFNYSCNSKENKPIVKEDIIQKSWTAMFGDIKNEDLKSIYVEAYFHGSEIPNKMTIQRPNKFRNEFENGLIKFDGEKPSYLKLNEETNDFLDVLIEPINWKHFEVDIAIAFPAYFEYESIYKGIYTDSISSSYELFVSLPMGSNVSYFIDTESYLVTRRMVSWDGNPNNELWENIIPAYTNYDGIFYPDAYQFKGKDGMEQGIFKNFKINVFTDPEMFKSNN